MSDEETTTQRMLRSLREEWTRPYREALEEIAAWRGGNPTPRVIAEAALAEGQES